MQGESHAGLQTLKRIHTLGKYHHCVRRRVRYPGRIHKARLAGHNPRCGCQKAIHHVRIRSHCNSISLISSLSKVGIAVEYSTQNHVADVNAGSAAGALVPVVDDVAVEAELGILQPDGFDSVNVTHLVPPLP